MARSCRSNPLSSSCGLLFRTCQGCVASALKQRFPSGRWKSRKAARASTPHSEPTLGVHGQKHVMPGDPKGEDCEIMRHKEHPCASFACVQHREAVARRGQGKGPPPKMIPAVSPNFPILRCARGRWGPCRVFRAGPLTGKPTSQKCTAAGPHSCCDTRIMAWASRSHGSPDHKRHVPADPLNRLPRFAPCAS